MSQHKNLILLWTCKKLNVIKWGPSLNNRKTHCGKYLQKFQSVAQLSKFDTYIHLVLWVRYLELCSPWCYTDLNLFYNYLKVCGFWYSIPRFSLNYTDFFSKTRYYTVFNFRPKNSILRRPALWSWSFICKNNPADVATTNVVVCV